MIFHLAVTVWQLNTSLIAITTEPLKGETIWAEILRTHLQKKGCLRLPQSGKVSSTTPYKDKSSGNLIRSYQMNIFLNFGTSSLPPLSLYHEELHLSTRQEGGPGPWAFLILNPFSIVSPRSSNSSLNFGVHGMGAS